jgi:hypothetical protein
LSGKYKELCLDCLNLKLKKLRSFDKGVYLVIVFLTNTLSVYVVICRPNCILLEITNEFNELSLFDVYSLKLLLNETELYTILGTVNHGTVQ